MPAGNTYPYRRRLRAAGALFAGVLLLTGCADIVSDKLGKPMSTATPTPVPPNPEVQKQQQANQSLTPAALAVANSILADAENPKTQVKPSSNPNNPYAISNYTVMHADNEKLIDSTAPQIILEYDQAEGAVRVSSEDYYFASNADSQPQVFKGIRLFFSVPPNNALDTKVMAGGQAEVADFRTVLNGSSVVLTSAQEQSGIPYTLDIMQQQSDGNYTVSREVADPNTPTTAHMADPADITAFTDSLRGLEGQLEQGIR